MQSAPARSRSSASARTGAVAHAVIRGEDVVLARERGGTTSARTFSTEVVVEVVSHGALAR
jgi:hypothetical protein